MTRWLVRSALVLLAAGYWLAGRPSAVAAAERIDTRGEPLQTATDRAPFDLATRRGRVTVRPRAAFDISARVAGVEPYWIDRTAFLSPFDFALLWGDAAQKPLRDQLDYSQSWRFFFWRTETPLDTGYLIAHSANIHVIPGGANVRRALATVDAGDEVRLRGLLVDVVSEHGLSWSTSLVRDDHGDHGCEILWVEAVQVAGRVYE